MQTKISTIKEDGFAVTQSLELINSFAAMKVDVVGHDILFALLTQLKVEDEDLKEYRVPLIEIERAVNKSFNRKDIKRACDSLGTKIEVQDRVNSDNFANFYLFQKIGYKNGEIEAVFSSLLKPHLLQLKKKFSSSRFFGTVSNIRSKRIRDLYFLLNQFLKAGSYTIQLNRFHNFIQASETDKEKFSALERRFLKKAIREINEKTDLKVSYYTSKKRRIVTKIIFEISGSNGIKEAKKELTLRREKVKETVETEIIDHVVDEIEERSEVIEETQSVKSELVVSEISLFDQFPSISNSAKKELSQKIFMRGIELINKIIPRYNKVSTDDEILQVYFEKVKFIEQDEYIKKVGRLVANWKYPTFPTPAQFLSSSNENSESVTDWLESHKESA